MDPPTIVLFIVGETILSSLLYGYLSRTVILGGSVAKAKEAKVSIIRLTHNISIVFKGDSLRTTAPKKDMNKATKLTVN